MKVVQIELEQVLEVLLGADLEGLIGIVAGFLGIGSL